MKFWVTFICIVLGCAVPCLAQHESNNAGVAAFQAGNYEKAESLFVDALKSTTNDHDRLLTLQSLLLCLDKQGKEKEPYLTEAKALELKLFPSKLIESPKPKPKPKRKLIPSGTGFLQSHPPQIESVAKLHETKSAQPMHMQASAIHEPASATELDAATVRPRAEEYQRDTGRRQLVTQMDKFGEPRRVYIPIYETATRWVECRLEPQRHEIVSIELSKRYRASPIKILQFLEVGYLLELDNKLLVAVRKSTFMESSIVDRGSVIIEGYEKNSDDLFANGHTAKLVGKSDSFWEPI